MHSLYIYCTGGIYFPDTQSHSLFNSILSSVKFSSSVDCNENNFLFLKTFQVFYLQAKWWCNDAKTMLWNKARLSFTDYVTDSVSHNICTSQASFFPLVCFLFNLLSVTYSRGSQWKEYLVFYCLILQMT